MSINVKILISAILLLFLISNVKGLVLFNQVANITNVNYYNSTNSTRIDPTADYDIFRDNAVINDSIYFMFDRGTWNNLTMNVTTGVVNTTWGLTWEYFNTSSVWSPLTIIKDGTNNFTTTGTNTIEFNVPVNWLLFGENSLLNKSFSNIGYAGYYIRARVTKVTGLTEGGRIRGLSTTNRDNTYTVRGIGNRMSDLVTASSNGIYKYNSYYFVTGNILIGNATSTTRHELIIRSNELVEMGNSTYVPLLMEYNTNCSFILGNLSGNDTSESSYFKYYVYGTPCVYSLWGGACYNRLPGVEVYNSVLYKNAGSYNNWEIAGLKAKNSIIEMDMIFLSSRLITGFVNNSILSLLSSGTNFYLYNKLITYNNALLGKGNGILAGDSGSTIANTNLDKKQFLTAQGAKAYCLDCGGIDNYTRQFIPNGNNQYVFANYTLTIDLFLVNNTQIYDANVSIVDSTGRYQFNGTWINSTIINTYMANQSAGGELRFNYNPFTITISRSGMVDYKTVLNITNSNKYLSVTMGYYPFDFNGTLVISKGKTVRVIK